MYWLSGYRIITQVYASPNSYVYRAIHEEDEYLCILKVMRETYPKTREKAHFRREFDILRKLNLEGVVEAYRLVEDQGRLVMVLEDFGGESLKKIMLSKRPALSESLIIAIKVSEILGQVHQHNIVHKDINPSNIVWNSRTNQVKIIDFGISTELSRENPEILNPDVIQGTLSYMSPEQAGRMNRAMDYRTDIYALGVTLYEMMTGQLPFKADNTMELMHAHMAEKPLPPHEIDATIPRPLSDIVMKLMSKVVEERYQSTFGLKQDLEYCLDQFESKGEIRKFQIARNDISDRFQISEKLYGRKQELKMLLSSFDRVSQGSKEMLMVAGSFGVGKSVLVHEVHKSIVEKRGYFLSGKFDQFKRNIPYFAFVQAFQGMVRQILSEPMDRFLQWKDHLLKVLGPNGRIIIDIIPEIELIIGEQPDVPILPPQESQDRFNLVFQNFIQVFAGEEHPLVLFLDDLQYADPPSIKMISLLMHQVHTRYLLIICSYRDNEMFDAHPLIRTARDLEAKDITVHTITLDPLSVAQVNRLVSDTLKRDEHMTRDLSLVCHSKTHGNPFFLKQFLQTLYIDGMIELDRQQGLWEWDISRIEKMTVTDNVIELMTGRIRKLSRETQHILKLASCIGNTFDLKTLSIVNEKSPFETSAVLWEALTDGLILPMDDAYKFIDESDDNPKVFYRFLHDGIQQASYSMIEKDRRKEFHLKIGRLILLKTPVEEQGEKIFSIVNQLNDGKELVTDETQKEILARLNLTAGLKAKSSAAYESAINYFQTGISLMDTVGWDTAYDLTLALYTEATEAVYLNADFHQMDILAETGLDHARTLLDKIRIYEIKIFGLTAQNRLLESVRLGMHVLRVLKDPLPEKPNLLHVLFGFAAAKFILKGRTIESLSHLPEMTHPEKLAVMRIMGSIGTSVYLASPKLLPLIPFKNIKLAVKYGCAPETAYLFGAYGLFLSGSLGKINAGYDYGRLCLMLGDRPTAKRTRARSRILMEAFIRHWKEHVRDSLKHFQETYQLALDIGDIEYVVIAVHLYLMYSYHAGGNLEDLNREFGFYDKTIRQFKQKTHSIYISICRQAVRCLRGETDNPTRLSGQVYDAGRMLPAHKKANDRSAIFFVYLNKMILNYLFEDYRQAVEYAEQGEEYLESVTGMFVVPVFYFYDSLSRSADIIHVDKPDKKRYMKKIRHNQKKMKKWAMHAPMNHQHKYDLVAAEVSRIKGNRQRAVYHFEKAIKNAGVNNYIQEQALGYELAAKFFVGIKMTDRARDYMTRAHHAYHQWGALAKADLLKEKFRAFTTSSLESHDESSGGMVIVR